MAVDCSSESLQAAGRTYCCVPPAMQGQVMIYLLNVISGLNLTPEELMQRASCYRCIPKGMEAAVMLYLLCANADAAGA